MNSLLPGEYVFTVCERYINDACHKDSVVFNDKLYKPLVVGGTEAAPKEFPHMVCIE